MVQPIDYMGMLPQVDIGQSLLSGIQAGAAIRQVRDQRAEQERAVQMQEQYNAALQDYLSSPSAQKAAAMSVQFPGQMKAIKQSWDLQSQGQRDADFGTGMKVYSALNTGRPEIAKQVLSEQITAMKNSGQDASDLESILGSIDTNPQAASAAIGITLSAMEPEKFGKAATEFREAQKAPFDVRKSGAEAFKAEAEAAATPERVFLENQQSRANINNINSQISDRGARLNLDRDKLQSDVEAKLYELGQKQGQLNESGQKLVNDATTNAVIADQAAGRLDDLAGRIEQEGGGYGVASTAGEWLKRVGGFQNGMTDLRNEYTRIRNAEAIRSLPPGVATDKDIELALKGIPDSSADSATMTRFLRGAAKLNRIASVGENAKAEWVNSVGFLGKPKTDIVIDGVNVPAGTTYSDFLKGYITDKVAQRGAEQAQQQLPQRSYMKYANPGAQ